MEWKFGCNKHASSTVHKPPTTVKQKQQHISNASSSAPPSVEIAKRTIHLVSPLVLQGNTLIINPSHLPVNIYCEIGDKNDVVRQ